MVFEVIDVPSKSRQGLFHHVSVIDGCAEHCSCESWVFRKMPCHAMKEIGVAQ
jgi:hypothetical protein